MRFCTYINQGCIKKINIQIRGAKRKSLYKSGVYTENHNTNQGCKKKITIQMRGVKRKSQYKSWVYKKNHYTNQMCIKKTKWGKGK